jgi:hypothetical protein
MLVCKHCTDICQRFTTEGLFIAHLSGEHNYINPKVKDHFPIHNYGDEDPVCFTDDFLMECIIMGPGKGVPRYIQHLYLNDDYPENKTILFDVDNVKHIKVFMNGEFFQRERDEIISEIIVLADNVLAKYGMMRLRVIVQKNLENHNVLFGDGQAILSKRNIEYLIAFSKNLPKDNYCASLG